MNNEELSLSIKNLHRTFFKKVGREPSCIESNAYYVEIDQNGEVYLNDGSGYVGLEKNNKEEFVRRKIEGFTREEIKERDKLELKIYDILKLRALLHLKKIVRR